MGHPPYKGHKEYRTAIRIRYPGLRAGTRERAGGGYKDSYIKGFLAQHPTLDSQLNKYRIGHRHCQNID